VYPQAGQLAEKQQFSVYPKKGALEEKQQFTVYPEEGQLTEKQQFCVYPEGGQLTEKQQFCVYPEGGQLTEKEAFGYTPTATLPYVVSGKSSSATLAIGGFNAPFFTSTTAGDFLWVAAYVNDNTKSITTPSGWSAGPSKADSVGKLWTFFRYNAPSVSSVTLNWGMGKANIITYALEIGGVSGSGSADLNGTGTGTSAGSWSAGTLGPTSTAHEFYLAAFGSNNVLGTGYCSGGNWFTSGALTNTTSTLMVESSRTSVVETFPLITGNGNVGSVNWSAVGQTFSF
jgi:hypothetical protein